MDYTCESFIDFCDRMEIASEGKMTALHKASAKTEYSFNQLEGKFRKAKTTSEKIAVLKELDKELSKSISEISRIRESANDKYDKSFKESMGKAVGIMSLIGTIFGAWYLKPIFAIGGFATSVVYGKSSEESDYYHNKRFILKHLKEHKESVQHAIKYLESEANNGNQNITSNSIPGYAKMSIDKDNSDVTVPFRKIANDICNDVKKDLRMTGKYEIEFDVTKRMIEAQIYPSSPDNTATDFDKLFTRETKKLRIKYDNILKENNIRMMVKDHYDYGSCISLTALFHNRQR